MKFETNRIALQTIAEMLQNVNFEAIISLDETQLHINLWDSARARLLFIDYPITIIEGSPLEFAVNTDWLWKKIKKIEGETIICEITEENMIFTESTTVKGVTLNQTYKLNLLDLDNSTMQATRIEEEPVIEQTVVVNIPDVAILRKAFGVIDGEHFIIFASEEKITIESEPDLSGPPSVSEILIVPDVLNAVENTTMHKVKEVADYLRVLKNHDSIQITFKEESPMIIESLGENIRFKFLSSPVLME